VNFSHIPKFEFWGVTKSLNTEQMATYKTIMSTVDSPKGVYSFLMVLEVLGRHFFIGHSLEQYDLKTRLLLPQLRLV
jgi:hypothetical protein